MLVKFGERASWWYSYLRFPLVELRGVSKRSIQTGRITYEDSIETL